MIKKITKDKLLHFAVCVILTSVIKLILPIWITILIVLVIAVGKEVYDYTTKKGNAEIGDIVADVLGLIIGVL